MKSLKSRFRHTCTLINKFLVSFMAFLGMLITNPMIVNAITYNNGTIEVGTSETFGKVNVPVIANGIFGLLNVILSGCTGIALITLTLVFVIKCAQLAGSGSNPFKRSNHISGMLWLAVSIGLLGFFNVTGGVISIIIGLSEGNFIS